MASHLAPEIATVLLVSAVALLAVGITVSAGPPLTRRTVLGATPWMVVGGALHALAVAGAYGGRLAAILGSALVVPAVVAIAALLWLPLVQVARLRARADPAGYLAASGTGVLVPVLATTVLAGQATVATLVPLAVTPVVAGVAAAAVVVVLGLSAAPALAAARSLALLAVYAQAFHAVAVAVAVDALGAAATGPFAAATVGLGASLVDRFGTAWPFLLVKLLGAALAVVVLGRLAERRSTAAYVLLGAISALGIGQAVAVLFGATLLA